MGAKVFLWLFLVSLQLQPITPAVAGDEIASLPGWDGPLPTKQYSGYIEIDATTGKYLHYWFVQSASNPETDPVVMWMNGGPGCSSLDGYFNEQGPLHFNRSEASSNATIPSLVLNLYAWNRIANMIFLEAPAGVGFSYSNTPSDYITNDNKTAQDNYNFLLKWFAAYPEYKNNDFYVSGESYAGIYVPTLVNLIRIMNEQGASNINLKGFMVGNGCIGSAVGGCGDNSGVKIHVDFYYSHALISDHLYNKIVSTCNFDHPHEPLCLILLEEMAIAIGRVNVYNIYTSCDPYGHGDSSSRANKAYRTLIYNGDVDACVPYIGDEQWTSGLGFSEKEGWRPWMINDQVPQFQPESAYAMFERYILNEPF
ncbi:hypothetical protein EMCRGX_G032672 [Ephydatia muelleri]